MKRLFIGGIATETNTFSPIPTGMNAFQEAGLFYGDATKHQPTHFSAPLHVWRRCADADGLAVAEGLFAMAQPGGTTLQSTWETLRDRLLEDARAALPLDMVLLNLHGAMVADGYDDCEGDLLQALREIVGPKCVIGAELDLHCHLTPAMTQATDILVAYKEYPHTDIDIRAEELYDQAQRKMMGYTRPIAAVADCHMISVWHTTRPPMSRFVQKMQALQTAENDVLSISFCHGFALGDVPQLGSRMLVYTDNDPELARELARSLAGEVFDMRFETRVAPLTPEEALREAISISRDRPVVIADTADNPGIGAGGDSTYMLRAMLDAGVRNAVSGVYYDPEIVRICTDCGVGARLRLRIGGKMSENSGLPLDLDVVVRAIRPDHVQTGVSGHVQPMGASAWVEAEGCDLVLSSIRSQTFHPDAFTGMGIELSEKSVVVVKSTQHFHAGFSPIASDILYVRTQGAVRFEGPSSPYRRRDGNYWPLVDNPRL